jgi:hypothetical protein
MPDVSKIINGKKFMWDTVVYGSEKEAQEVKQKHQSNDFEVELVEESIEEGKKYLVYTRRVVTEIVVEGEPPPA